MGRHPVNEAVLKVPLRGHQHFWSTMRELRLFSLADIDRAGNANTGTVRDYFKRLTKAEIIKAVGTAECGATVYEITRDFGPEAPSVRRDGTITRRPGTGNEQMWRAMKMLDLFTYLDLAVAASTDEVKVKPNTAHSFIKKLRKAGYLAVVHPANPPKTKAVYRLAKNTGPLAPMIQRTDWVWDPNLKRVMGPEAG